MYERSAVLAEVGVDWFTATVGHQEEGWFWMSSRTEQHLMRAKREGNEVKQSTMYGYSGIRVGANFVGSNGERVLVQVTSHRANEAFWDIYVPAAHVSRIDLQVTVRYKENHHEIASMAYAAAERANEKLPPSRRRSLTIYESNNGGATCYIGSKLSEQFGRIYNKYAESKDEHYKNCWRYEIVLKNDVATAAAKELARLPESRETVILSYVYNWLKQRGVVHMFPPPDFIAVVPTVPVERSDNQRKLDWLQSQVAPTVRYLLSAGLGDRMLLALGLPGELLEMWNENSVSRETPGGETDGQE